MPIFEYRCADCGHTMEFLEKRAGVNKHKCERCNSSKLEKLLSEFSVGRSAPPPMCSECPGGPCPASTGPCPCDMS